MRIARSDIPTRIDVPWARVRQASRRLGRDACRKDARGSARPTRCARSWMGSRHLNTATMWNSWKTPPQLSSTMLTVGPEASVGTDMTHATTRATVTTPWIGTAYHHGGGHFSGLTGALEGRVGCVSYMRMATTIPEVAVSAATAQMAILIEMMSARMPANRAPMANPASRHSR